MQKTLEATDLPTRTPAPSPGGLDLRDLLLGVIGAGMVVFAVVLLFFGGEGDTGSGRVDAPVITLVQPTSGAVVEGPLHVVFRSSRDLERGPGGWGAGDLHIHLDVNGREFMPGARDIEPLPNGMYRWTLSGLAAGEHEIRLFWAGSDHRPISSGASMPARIRAH